MNRNYMKLVLHVGDALAQKLIQNQFMQNVYNIAGVDYRLAGFILDKETNEATFELVKDKP